MISKPLNSQPQYYPTINRGHPLARGLVLDILMRDGVAVDLCGLLPPTASGLPRDTQPQGRGQSFSGTGYQMGSGLDASRLRINQQATLWTMQSSTPSTEMACLAFSGDFAGLWLGFYAGHPIFFFQVLGAAQFAYASSVNPSGLYQLAGTYSGDTGTGRVYGDGVELTSAVAIAGLDLTGFGTTVGIGNGTNNANPFTGTIFHQRLWNRCLTAGEIKSLKDNPWQIYASPNIFKGYAISAGATAAGGGGPFPFFTRRTLAGGMIGMG